MIPANRKEKGTLIAVEGMDGSGKSTQIYLLRRWLESKGHNVFFSEWNSSPSIKSATKRGKEGNLLTPSTFSLVHCADFADRYERQILPHLHAGFFVLCDRYIFTAFARDGVRGCDPQWLRQCYAFARIPDMTFFFDVPLQTALDRILFGRPTLKFHEAGMDLALHPDPYQSFALFQGKIAQQYHAMVPEFGLTRIDGDRPIVEVQSEMRQTVAFHLGLGD
ncbi:MAG: thymidylate kinase [bacterium]|jgi:dTMP kinase|nr:thymidylate kinase [bacterium]